MAHLPADVLPLTVAEMDFDLAPPIRDALRTAVDASDIGYSAAVPELGEAYAGFARARWDWRSTRSRSPRSPTSASASWSCSAR